MPRPIAFALPGSIDTVTGGTIYDRHLVDGLRHLGHPVSVIELPGTYPFPSDADRAATRAALSAVPADTVLAVDGLALGAFDAATLRAIRARLVGMVHHPLGHETGLPPDTAAALVATETAALAHAAHVLVPSAFTARTLWQDFAVPPDRVTVVLPGFDLPDSLRTPTDPPLILSVGLLAPRKGHATLIDALGLIADLPWRAVIAGADHDADHAAALRTRAAPLADRMTLPGLVPPHDLTALYRSAHVFALASHYEGYGMVLSEAIRHGLPIVACAAGAVPDTVPPGTGHLVPPADAARFADALRRLLTDPAHHAACATAAATAAIRLPRWTESAALASAVLDRL